MNTAQYIELRVSINRRNREYHKMAANDHYWSDDAFRQRMQGYMSTVEERLKWAKTVLDVLEMPTQLYPALNGKGVNPKLSRLELKALGQRLSSRIELLTGFLSAVNPAEQDGQPVYQQLRDYLPLLCQTRDDVWARARELEV